MFPSSIKRLDKSVLFFSTIAYVCVRVSNNDVTDFATSLALDTERVVTPFGQYRLTDNALNHFFKNFLSDTLIECGQRYTYLGIELSQYHAKQLEEVGEGGHYRSGAKSRL